MQSFPNMPKTSILWFRLDLRLTDNPALSAAVDNGTVIPLYVWSPEEEGQWPPGAASRWWLHQSLTELDNALHRYGSRLIIRQGPSLDQLRSLIHETGATSVFWNRRYEPAIAARDLAIAAELQKQGCQVIAFNSHLLFEPWDIKNKSGKPFRVFTPFWKTCLAGGKIQKTLPTVTKIPSPTLWPQSLPLKALQLEPKHSWAAEFPKNWCPGELGAQKNLSHFIKNGFLHYNEARNHPAAPGTSRLSPHLHFGEIGPRQIWHALPQKSGPTSQFAAELGWREFAYHLLHHFPQTPTEPLRPEFKNFPWRENSAFQKAWQRGKTGYPIIDAGMRELWTTGWMHNRVRMIAASFLVKDTLQPWQNGARWFWDTLVDADLANNTLGWQWCAGCGADAMPFFRIFNPITQGEKFDPQGHYIRRWVPELTKLPVNWLHHPWEAPETVLKAAGITLGTTYPRPIVSHTIAREIALQAYQKLPPR